MKPFTPSDIYQLLAQIGTHPHLRQAQLGKHAVWPVVKMALYFRLVHMAAHVQTPSLSAKLWQLVQQLMPKMLDTIVTLWRQKHTPHIAMIVTPKLVSAEPHPRESLFDALLTTPFPLPTILFHTTQAKLEEAAPNVPILHTAPLHSLAYPIAFLYWHFSPAFRRLHLTLMQALRTYPLPLTEAEIAFTLQTALSLFWVKTHLYQWLFRILRIRCLVLSDLSSKTAEIAAAKTLHIPVIELQHGLFAAQDPCYNWDATDRLLQAQMPLPDHIFLYGPLWQRILASHDYFAPHQLHIAGSAALDRIRASIPLPQPKPALTVLFGTQHTAKHEAIAFLRAFLAEAPRAPFFLHLIVKVHPLEAADDYESLAQDFPTHCQLLAGHHSIYPLLPQADCVLAYSSQILVEALGLGIPAISLCSDHLPGGCSDVFDFPNLTEVMPHIRTPESLWQLLQSLATSPQLWHERLAEARKSLYAEGFLPVATSFITTLLSE